MPGRTDALFCPDCRNELRPDRTKINVEIDQCPKGHGLFLDQSDLRELVGGPATSKLRDLVGRPLSSNAECPSCRSMMGDFSINNVNVRGCRNCGGLWFRNEDLRAHVHEVRKRAYGERSMAARLEVVRDATAFYPGEVVAGLLTDFQLENEL